MTNEGEDEDKNKKIMGIKDVMEEETKEIPINPAKAIMQKLGKAVVRKIKGREDLIVRFTFPKGLFERMKQTYGKMSKKDLRETLKDTVFTRSLPEEMEERLVENLMSAGKQKLAIVALSITSVQSSQAGITMDVYEKREEDGGENEA